MKFVAISDTHGKHAELSLPEGDVLLHAGDVSNRGLQGEVQQFVHWFAKQPFQYKVFIAGNHDFYFEKEKLAPVILDLPSDVYYLNDSGIEIEGIKIWGSPVQPWFFNWAFNRKRGEEIRKHWDLIPNGMDILITHGPPYGILDETARNEKVGCKDLMERVELVKPKVHLFGHIHEAYGETMQQGTHFINASVLNLQYYQVNDPIVFEM